MANIHFFFLIHRFKVSKTEFEMLILHTQVITVNSPFQSLHLARGYPFTLTLKNPGNMSWWSHSHFCMMITKTCVQSLGAVGSSSFGCRADDYTHFSTSTVIHGVHDVYCLQDYHTMTIFCNFLLQLSQRVTTWFTTLVPYTNSTLLSAWSQPRIPAHLTIFC